MHKNNFFAIIALFATSSLISMELATKEKQKFVVALHLQERKSKNILDPAGNDADCYACTVLGIPWEENNNKYLTNFAFIRKAEDIQLDFESQSYHNCWRRNFIGMLPLTKQPHPKFSTPFQYCIKFPDTLPAAFIERLEKEKSITLNNTQFADPVEIVVELDSLSKLQKFVVALDLREVKKEVLQDDWNKLYDEEDKHACKVLGITWEENNNIYFTNRAGIRKFDETKYINCWKHNYIDVIPKSTIPDIDNDKEYEYSVKFPKSLPATFVERLEKEKFITLENAHFAEPVEIIVTLLKLKKLKKHNNESESSES